MREYSIIAVHYDCKLIGNNSVAIFAAVFSMGRKLMVDKTLRLKRQGGAE